MSIPIDKLYHYFHDSVNHNITIYRWTPHGSKKLTDLHPLRPITSILDSVITPVMICHDQEPLDYYCHECKETKKEILADKLLHHDKISSLPEFSSVYDMPGLRLRSGFGNLHDLMLLTHSEINSSQIKIYEDNGFVPVYIWSHAIIARDWYRYAEIDPTLLVNSVKYDFLIYNRAWSGTREYRLKFAELIVAKSLASNCLMGFSPYDTSEHYTNHKFKNNAFNISANNLEHNFFLNTADANSSADYVNTDYAQCGIEVVLETLFDDSRWHLTEKSLRPIACGKPFILAATPGSLRYLKSYGFETFDGILDESYDNIVDPVQRLNAIVAEMQRISNMHKDQKAQMLSQLNLISQRNKQRFFSVAFQEQVMQEYKENFYQGYSKVQNSRHGEILFRHLNFVLTVCPPAARFSSSEIDYLRSLLILK